MLVAAVLVLFPACVPPGSDTAPGHTANQAASADHHATPLEATVTTVIDGDTIEVEMAGRRHRVRLLGVDSPESVHPELPEQCYGKEATEGLSRLLPPGSEIIIERDVELHDRYQRLLLYVYRRPDGLFVNRWLVEQGLAEAVFYPPNVHFRPEIQRARQQARAARRGLWGHCEGPDQPLR
jgi:micrococcal nuclease